MAASVEENQTFAEIRRENGEEISIPQLKEVFSKVDTNGDNLISFQEFCLAIEELGIRWELETAKTAFKTMDENGNKSLDWYEFSHGIHLVNPSVKAFWTNIFKSDNEPAGGDSVEQEDLATTFELEEMLEILQNKKTDWKKRNRMLNFLPVFFQDLDETEFVHYMDLLAEPLGMQITERKSAVARDACLTTALLAKHRQIALLPYVHILFPALYNAIRMNINVISESGKNAGKALIQFVPDDDSHALLNTLVKGQQEKHKQVRARIYEYLRLLAEQEWAQERLANDPIYWEKYKETLIKGTGDKDAEGRKSCFRAIIGLKLNNMEDLYQDLFENLDRSKQKAVIRTEKSMKS